MWTELRIGFEFPLLISDTVKIILTYIAQFYVQEWKQKLEVLAHFNSNVIAAFSNRPV